MNQTEHFISEPDKVYHRAEFKIVCFPTKNVQ